MASTAPQRTNALRDACQFERVVEPVSFTPISGLLAGNRFLRICPVVNSAQRPPLAARGKTPMQTFLDAMPMTKEKMIAA